MMISLLALLAPGAVAQDDVYKSLATGDRVEVMFRNGNTITGTLVPPPQYQRPKAREPRTAAGGPPYLLFVLVDPESGESATQLAAVESWRKRHPEASVRRVDRSQQPDLWRRYSVETPPALIFEVPGGKGAMFAGFHSEDRLEEALAKFRAGSEGDGIDYGREAMLTLDISLEYPGLDGTMSVFKTEIRDLRKLQKLDDATLKRLQDEKRKAREDLAREEAARREEDRKRSQKFREDADRGAKERADAEAAGSELKARIAEAERISKGLEFLSKFPPPTWGQDRLNEITRKGGLKLQITPQESEFSKNYDLWLEAYKYKQEQDKAKGKEAPKEAPKETPKEKGGGP
jgi:hypothetical protein